MPALLPPAALQFADANGKPYAGGTLTAYMPGTSTLKTTWSDAAGTRPNENPIVLDLAGRCIVYGDGAYRTILADADGNVVWDQESTTLVSAAMQPVVTAVDLPAARDAMGVTSAITAAVAAEASTRSSADSAINYDKGNLWTALGSETTARTAADTTLTTNLAAEIARAEAAETALGARIDGVVTPGGEAPAMRGGLLTTNGAGEFAVTWAEFNTGCIVFQIYPPSAAIWPEGVTISTPVISSTQYIVSPGAGTRTGITGTIYTLDSGGVASTVSSLTFGWIALGY